MGLSVFLIPRRQVLLYALFNPFNPVNLLSNFAGSNFSTENPTINHKFDERGSKF